MFGKVKWLEVVIFSLLVFCSITDEINGNQPRRKAFLISHNFE
jgi:hypothetical protein